MKNHLGLISIIMFLIIISCTTISGVPTPTHTIEPSATPTETYTELPTITNTPTETPHFIVFSDEELTINGVTLPDTITIEDLDKVLGTPTRVSELELGTVYVLDEAGMTYRTDVDSKIVTNIDLYCGETEYLFSPTTLFEKDIFVNNLEFPYKEDIDAILKVFPDLEDLTDIGFFYRMDVGNRELYVIVALDTKMVESIAISLVEE